MSSMCSIKGHHWNCAGEMGLPVELTKSGDMEGRLEELGLQASPGGCEEDRLKEGLEFLGTKALGHLSCESRGQEPAYSAPRHTVSPRVQRDTEAQVHADRQGQLKWVVQGPCTQPLGVGRESFAGAPVLRVGGVGHRWPEGPKVQLHFLNTASPLPAWPHKGLECSFRSISVPPMTLLGPWIHAQISSGFLWIQMFLTEPVFRRGQWDPPSLSLRSLWSASICIFISAVYSLLHPLSGSFPPSFTLAQLSLRKTKPNPLSLTPTCLVS